MTLNNDQSLKHKTNSEMTQNQRLVRVFIVDDDANSINLLEKLLQSYSVSVVGKASDATEETMTQIIEEQPDMLFLDVEMPSMTGLEFYSELRPLVNPDMKVVFYTGYDKYMIDALRRQAFDFMLKPTTREELSVVMTRYYESRLSTLQQAVQENISNTQHVMVVNAFNEHTVLRFDDIAFFRFDSDRRIWEVVTSQGECHQLRHRTTADIIIAYSSYFVQIHKRYIVNVRKISKVLDNLCVMQPPLDNIRELHISKNYRRQFMATFYAM